MEINLVTAKEFAPVLERLAQLEKDNEILKRVVKQNGDMIDSAEAMRRTGIKSLATLKKQFTATPQGRLYYFSKVEIETYLADLELRKAPKLRIAS